MKQAIVVDGLQFRDADSDGLLGRAESHDFEALKGLVGEKNVTSFVTRLKLAPAQLAEQSNAAQVVAAAGRLSIPLTISTDPHNHFNDVLGTGETATFGSQAALTSDRGGADGLQPDGVMTVVKHRASYAAQPEGFDGLHRHNLGFRL